ncbi:hypothetical protein HZA96_00450 [Candidatus Woesearchaeota archaeon]|nr:hypothetical protein [Candidatus Woesearchaeota archaeon]
MVNIYNSGLVERAYGHIGMEYYKNRGIPTADQIASGRITVEQMKALNSLVVPGVSEFENHGVTYLSTEYRR